MRRFWCSLWGELTFVLLALAGSAALTLLVGGGETVLDAGLLFPLSLVCCTLLREKRLRAQGCA